MSTAQVAIAAGYFPAYARLPRKAQRKADEFIRKFCENPKQPSIHYEPILGAVDKQLRSVRVGDDYRAIVRAPERGNVFLLLWIDHHDEAYRWAEGKQVEVHPKTGTIQFFDVDAASAAVTAAEEDEPPSGTRSPPGEQAFEEKRLFSSFTDEQLFTGGVPLALLPAVRAVHTEEDLDRLIPHLPQEAADLLTGLAAGYDYDAVLEQILEATTVAPEEPVDPRDIDQALQRESSQREFRLLDENFDLDKALSYPLDVWRVYLHPSQRKIVEAHTKGPLRLTGGAGTGKTVVAMHRAAFLVRKVFQGPDDRILVTTFTTNLAHDIRENLGKLLEPEELTRVDVVNIDAWAGEFLASRGKALRLATRKHQEDAWRGALDVYGVDGFDLRFCRSEWEAVIQAQGIRDVEGYVRAVRHHRGQPLSRAERRKLWDVFSEYRANLQAAGVTEAIDILRAAREELDANPLARPYRSVIVDETQDMNPEALRLIRALAGPEGPNDLLLVGDAHQRIYGRAAPLSQSGINIRGRRSRELRLNYRTTAAICRWSLQTLGEEEFDDLDDGKASRKGYVSLRQGERPVVRHFEHLAAERAFLVAEIRQLLQQGHLPDEICVVARTNKLLEDSYGPALAAAGIDFELLQKQRPRSGTVRLATMHRVKGLEFPVVFVAAVNAGLMPLATPDLTSDDPLLAAQATRQERCLLYVATSRARDRLYVTSYGDRSEFLDGLSTAEAPPEPGSLQPVEGTALPSERGSLVLVPTSAPAPVAPSPTSAPALVAPSPPPTALSPLPEGWQEEKLLYWSLPTRMRNWLENNGIETVGQLIALDPSLLLAQRNLGRKSIADTEDLIRFKLGESWAALREQLGAESGPEPSGEDIVSPAELDEVLEESLANWPLPTRLQNWAERAGVSKVRDLVLRSPIDLVAEPNVGRASVASARQLLERRLGRRWEELRRALSSAETGAASPKEVGWNELKETLPQEVLGHELTEVPLPARMRTFVENEGLRTVADLVAFPQADLAARKNLGRRSIKDTREALLTYVSNLESRQLVWESGFLPSLKDAFSELDTVARMIVTRRAGLGGQPETLEEIGSTLGVTRERIRQIEKKTWDGLTRSKAWAAFVLERCREVAPGGAVPLDNLEEHPWWQGLASDPDALDYFCDRLLGGAFRVVQLDGERYLARTTQADLDAALGALKRTLRTLSFPLPLREVEGVAQGLTEGLGETLGRVVWENASARLVIDQDSNGEPRAVSYGSGKHAQAIAFLDAQPGPVSVNTLIAEVGRGELPDEVFLFGRGLVGLEKHFPNYQSYKALLAPRAIAVMRENGPERQWSCAELLESLREDIDLPDWLTHWHLGAILRRSEGIEYLGRLRVALPGVADESGRIYVHVALERILTEAGHPLPYDTLVARLRAKTDANDLTVIGRLHRPPFLKVDKAEWGLLGRDLPGGVEAMAEALDHLEGLLERRQRGLSSVFVHREVTQLSPQHGLWTIEMCLSVTRGDPRFRLSISGNLGLSSWESVRVPTRAELVQTAIDASNGRVSTEAVCERIAAHYGTRPDRVALATWASRFGARLDGDWIVRS